MKEFMPFGYDVKLHALHGTGEGGTPHHQTNENQVGESSSEVDNLATKQTTLNISSLVELPYYTCIIRLAQVLSLILLLSTRTVYL